MDDLTDFVARHPADLLRDFVYRKPDEYLSEFDQSKKDCEENSVPPYTPITSKRSKMGVKRTQFMTGDYNSLDDGYP